MEAYSKEHISIFWMCRCFLCWTVLLPSEAHSGYRLKGWHGNLLEGADKHILNAQVFSSLNCFATTRASSGASLKTMAWKPTRRSTQWTLALVVFMTLYLCGGATIFAFLEGFRDDLHKEQARLLLDKKKLFLFEHSCIRCKILYLVYSHNIPFCYPVLPHTSDLVAESLEYRLPMWKGRSSNPSRVKLMPYKIDTCHCRIWRLSLIG